MFDHISFGVTDIARSRAFYDAALAPLGLARLVDASEGSSTNSAYGRGQQARFWICQDPADKPRPSEGLHFAFEAADRGAVDSFHKAGVSTGGSDNGAPGIRPHYHANYYA